MSPLNEGLLRKHRKWGGTAAVTWQQATNVRGEALLLRYKLYTITGCSLKLLQPP